MASIFFLTIMLSNYSSGGEALFVGLLQGLFIGLIIWGVSKFRNRKKKE